MEQLTTLQAGRESLSLRDVAHNLFRHKRLLLTLLMVWTALLASYALLNRGRYAATMTLLVKNQRTALLMSADQTASLQRGTDARDSQIATEAELLSGTGVMQEVAGKSGLDKASGKTLERAAIDLRQHLTISPVLKADLIKVKYESSDRDQALRVLQNLLAVYMNRHVNVLHNPDALPFFEKQAGDYEAKLRTAQAKLTGFEGRTGITLLHEQKDLAVRKLSELESSVRAAGASLQESNRQVQVLRQQLQGLQSRITTQKRQIPNQYSIERLNTMLAELENKRTGLLTKFHPGDRLVTELDQQIRDTQNALQKAQALSAVEESTDINPLHQAVERELARAELSAETSRVRQSELGRQVREQRAELSKLDSATADHNDLSLQVKQSEDSYKLYFAKREEARIGDALDKQNIANVAVAEPPSVPQEASTVISPPLIGAYLLGCSLIFCITYALAARRTTFETPWELEAFTGLPVLATLAFRSNRVKMTAQQIPARVTQRLPFGGVRHEIDSADA